MMDELLQSAAWAARAVTESDALSRLAGVAVRGTLLLLAALLLAHALRTASAAVRHLVWSGALGGVLVMLVASFAVPAWELPILPPAPAAPASEFVSGDVPVPGEGLVPAFPMPAADQPAPEVVARLERALATSNALAEPGPATATVTERLAAAWPPAPATLLGLAYALGVMLVLARLLVGSLGVQRLARRAEPVLDADWHLLLQRLARQLGVRRPVTLLRSDRRAVPVTWGVVYPVILLPSDALAWGAERRRLVLLHELAHVARVDALTHVLTQLAAAALWFNPLVWVAVRRMRAECERACDDVVLAAGERASLYADDLLDIARTLHHAGGPAFAAWAMARRSEIEGRLLAILDPGVKRARAGRRGAAVAAALTALVALPLAVVQPRRAEAAATPAPFMPTLAEDAALDQLGGGVGPLGTIDSLERALNAALRAAAATAPADPASPAAPVSPASPVLAAAAPAGGPDCGSGSVRGRSWRGFLRNSNDHATTIAISDDTTCVEVRMEGEVTFTDDDRDVASVTRGGRFLASERKRGVERVIEIRPGERGLERRYVVDGEPGTDAEARAWLAQLLPGILRESAVNAKQRVARARREGGAAGVMTLISRTQSDGAKRAYFGELLEGGVTPDTLRLLAQLAARTISSDGDKSAVLRQIASARRGDAALGTAVVTAARTISSDGDKRNVLQAVLAESGTGVSLAEMGEAVADISSDGDKAAVLVGMPARWRADDASRRAYFRAVNSISSDGDRRHVLTRVLEDSMDAPTLVALLEAAGDISSDGDKSAVLSAVARRYTLDGDAVRRAFFAAANSVSSDGDRRSALQAALARRPLGVPVMLDLLSAAEEISSDHDKSTVLLAVAGRPELREPAVRTRFFDVLKTVSSSSDYRRVMESVVQR